MKILLTGATGNIGSYLLPLLTSSRPDSCLLSRGDGSEALQRCVTLVPNTPLKRRCAPFIPSQEGNTLTQDFDLVIHAAADTRFTASLDDLRLTNVELTKRHLAACRPDQRFIHLSTICVCGDTSGLIPEARLSRPAHFLNAYEESKWEAEQFVLDSGKSVEIVRLATACGSLRDGSVPRPGGFHQALYWLYHGLVPMIPGQPDTPVDLVSLEFVADAIARIVDGAPRPGAIHHITSGAHALPLGRLLELAREVFARHHRGWKNGSIAFPQIVDAETFRLFEDSVRQSGDALFRRVLHDAAAFLPGLLHPHSAATSHIPPFTESEHLATRSLEWLCRHHWPARKSPAFWSAPVPRRFREPSPDRKAVEHHRTPKR